MAHAPITPRDPLDSPSTLSVASTHSQLSDAPPSARSHDGGATPHSSSFAELLGGLLGPIAASRAADEPPRELALPAMWPAPLPNEATSTQYIGGGGARPPSRAPLVSTNGSARSGSIAGSSSSGAAIASAGGSPAQGGALAAMRAMLAGTAVPVLGHAGAALRPSEQLAASDLSTPLDGAAELDARAAASAPSCAAGGLARVADEAWGMLTLESGAEASSAPPTSTVRGRPHMIGRSNRVFIVFNHHKGVPKIP